LYVISHFSDIWALVGEKSQKKLGEIQKKKFHPVISGAFFLANHLHLDNGPILLNEISASATYVNNFFYLASRGIKLALKSIVSYVLFF
jgi:hypothetical protein